jgi:hypothetical protein
MEAVETSSRRWAYVGVGCLTAVIGLVGGGMIAVFVAKVVGAIRGCTPDAETGSPCGWTTYWTWGARVGLIVVPSVAIWRMRRGEKRELTSSNTETG